MKDMLASLPQMREVKEKVRAVPAPAPAPLECRLTGLFLPALATPDDG